MLCLSLIFLVAAAATVAAAALPPLPPPPPPPAAIAPHPRLVLTPARIAALQLAMQQNATDAQLFLQLLAEHADWALTQPVVAHGVPGPSGILVNVRNAFDLMVTSAAAHLLRSNLSSTAYRDRAVKEALNLCVSWPDWNLEQHALDTGEALVATALTYDWLYNDLTTAERASIGGGIVSRGLAPYRQFMGNATVFWWKNNSINWNCVCSGGGIVSVLALYNDVVAPPWAYGEIFAPLVTGVAPCVGAYNSDASWEEGPGYWNYASKYIVWIFSALQSVFGNTSGLAQLGGVERAARFPIYSTGANAIKGTGASYNWADAGTEQVWSPFATWWGRASGFNDSAAVFWGRLGTRLLGPASLHSFAWGGFAEALAFFDAEGDEADLLALPTAHFYDYINVASWRSPWNATQNNFLAIKGGNSEWNHNHLDLGSFVFDYNGKRYAEDMGADNYALPGYFSIPQRWTYYRLNSRGHNVLLFGNESQHYPAVAPITLFNATFAPAKVGTISLDGFAIVDLTAAYANSVAITSYRRGFISLSASACVVVVEELVYSTTGPQPRNATFQLHTRASATQLSRIQVALGPVGSGATLGVVPSPEVPGSFGGFVFTDLATLLPDPPYDSAAGYTRVDIVFSGPVGSNLTRVVVALGDAPIVATLQFGFPVVRPMRDWNSLGPLDVS